MVYIEPAQATTSAYCVSLDLLLQTDRLQRMSPSIQILLVTEFASILLLSSPLLFLTLPSLNCVTLQRRQLKKQRLAQILHAVA